ncbi:hypothetical protein CALVIDRAFT_327355 [Calocera viscosa TUFC12733]|uniref:Secreted protein n=1 Tax=Calocera viscosa (strain TUFC12733) TaxID=1330018 RepID=A0A167QVP5_CALVF|nr:hypothetical protein CALVIDRAFT_327355 [Calocera viscosa TUFC12733]
MGSPCGAQLILILLPTISSDLPMLIPLSLPSRTIHSASRAQRCQRTGCVSHVPRRVPHSSRHAIHGRRTAPSSFSTRRVPRSAPPASRIFAMLVQLPLAISDSHIFWPSFRATRAQIRACWLSRAQDAVPR